LVTIVGQLLSLDYFMLICCIDIWCGIILIVILISFLVGRQQVYCNLCMMCVTFLLG